MVDIKIDKVAEWDIDIQLQEKIHHLLGASFSGYPAGRTFFRQQPAFRYLVWLRNELVGHCAIDARCVYNANALRSIFGLSDFCIAPSSQATGLGRHLMERIIKDSQQTHIDFILSFSGEHAFYDRLGFKKYDTTCRWLILSGDRSFGLVERKLDDCLFVLPMKVHLPWDGTFVDLLGPAF